MNYEKQSVCKFKYNLLKKRIYSNTKLGTKKIFFDATKDAVKINISHKKHVFWSRKRWFVRRGFAKSGWFFQNFSGGFYRELECFGFGGYHHSRPVQQIT